MRLRLLCGAMALIGMGISAYSHTVVKPDAKIDRTSFAVITDTPTWEACSQQLKEYASVLGEEGLPTFLIYDRWKSPEQVKKVILDLYKKKNLEGVVFVGDIPIPMIRKAQHLTSAFKMSETRFPFNQSSVPSDRFYDDFDLKFDYLHRDSVNPLFFYYDLAVDSPQQIRCDIYSARVKGVGENEDHHAQIRDFFTKAVKLHREANPMDQFFSYTGEGSYSNSMTAWIPEAEIIRQQMPGAFDSPEAPGRARFMRYNFSDYPKEDVKKMLRRDNLDLAIFHEHGVPERQYLSGIPASFDLARHASILAEELRSMARRNSDDKETFDKFEKKYGAMGFNRAWWENWSDSAMLVADSISDLKRGMVIGEIQELAPNSRMVIFDACYNGDFREPDYIAGRYIMAPGKCVTTFANSVNVLQDKQANELLGLLWLGARVGQWAQLTNILESHITGDPTYRFAPSASGIDGAEMLSRPYNEAEQLALLKSEYPDVRSAALHRLWANDYPGLPAILVDTYRNSPAAMERYTALHLLEQLNGDEYRTVLAEAINDPYEFNRRIAVSRMGQVGLDEYVPCLVKAYRDCNNDARVVFNVERSMQCFDSVAVNNAIGADTCELARKLRVAFSNQKSANSTILSKSESPKWRKLAINSLRNVPINATVDEYLALIQDPEENEEVKITMIEALAWYGLSHRRADIAEVCRNISRSSDASKAMKQEALRTYYRLK